ncbi:MAG: hypothetical protein ACLPN1_07285 [Dissulfurispiraceae bacterium]
METGKESKDSDTSAGRKKNIGVKVDEMVWRQFRALAISQGKTAGDLLDQLMSEYVGKSRSDTSNQ